MPWSVLEEHDDSGLRVGMASDFVRTRIEELDAILFHHKVVLREVSIVPNSILSEGFNLDWMSYSLTTLWSLYSWVILLARPEDWCRPRVNNRPEACSIYDGLARYTLPILDGLSILLSVMSVVTLRRPRVKLPPSR